MKKDLHVVVLRPDTTAGSHPLLRALCMTDKLPDGSPLMYLVCTSIDTFNPRYLVVEFTKNAKKTKLYIPHEFILTIAEIASHKNPLGFLGQQESPGR